MAERQDDDPQEQYVFRNIQLLKNETLGTGSYGAVCKAKCDQLLCAAKLLYPVYFKIQAPDNKHRHAFKRFQKECQFLKHINHPNIVQYMGTYRDPETNIPVLLMELMDESLTHFLESSPGDLPYHTQVNLSYDVAQALAFLHSNGIVHRDLSSNNVLLLASTRAKVTDFGMSKIIDLNTLQQVTSTTTPGNPNYMSPEVFKERPEYTEKLDNFSFGVLLVQIITREFPKPANQFKTRKLVDPDFPEKKITANIPVCEVERRQAHIDLIPTDHPLLPTALHCLKDNECERPHATQLCQTLSELKEKDKYQESSRQDLQQILKEKDEQDIEKAVKILEKDILISEKLGQLKDKNKQLREKDKQLDEKNKQLIACNKTIKIKMDELVEKKEKITNLEANCSVQQETIQQRDREVSELRQALAGKNKQDSTIQLQNVALQDKIQAPSTRLATIRRWWSIPNIPAANMKHGSSAVIGDQAYFKSHDDKVIYAFSNLNYQWDKLSSFPKSFRSIVNINYMLTAVGSKGLDTSSGKTYSYNHGQWEERFPSMPNKRSNPAVVYADNTLVVAGGHIENVSSRSVDILKTQSRQWSSVSSLPVAMGNPSVTICGDDVYIHPRTDDQEKNSVYKSSLEELVQSEPSDNIWEKIASLKVSCSSLVTVNGHLLAVGGREDGHATNKIYQYINASWTFNGQMTSPRLAPLTTVLPGNKLMVVGASAKCELADII